MAFFFPATRRIFPGEVSSADRGGPAPYPLAIPAPPNTAGYTTRTITAAEANGYVSSRDVASMSVLLLELDDATDYVISSPEVIYRPVSIRGGRNIIWIGAHVHLKQLGVDFFPGAAYVQALHIEDGVAAQSGRIIHLEGHWYEGEDLADALIVNCPTAHIRIGNWRVTGACSPRSTDAAGNSNPAPPVSNQGVRMYSGVEQVHSDLFKSNSDYLTLTVDRCTAETAVTGWQFDHGGVTSTSMLRRCNVRAMSKPMDQEGPLGTEVQTYTVGTNRATFEATQDSFIQNCGGSPTTLTYPYSTAPAPLSGTVSLKVDCTSPTVLLSGAGRNFAAPTDWSASGAHTSISALVHVVSSSNDYPMMRIDATDNASASQSGQEDYWYIGQSHNCTVGVTRRLISNFPPEVLGALRKVRVVLLLDEQGAGSHSFIIDDVSTGNGMTIPTFTGPSTLTLDGKWALSHRPASDGGSAGELYLSDFYSQAHPNLEWERTGAGTGTNYKVRYWDFTAGGGAGAYVLDPPPGSASHEDFYNPPPATTGTDGTGNYAAWDSTVAPLIRARATPAVEGSGRVYDGSPPSGDFVSSGIAGERYTPFPTYLPEIWCFAQGQSSATLAVATPAPVPLGTAAAVSTATLDLTAPSTGFSPTDIAGLECWLKADAIGLSDGANVTTWEDSHTSNKDATSATGQTYETNEINGLPVVRFDGVDDTMAVSGITNNDATRTVFCVQRNISHTTQDAAWGFGNTSKMASMVESPAWRVNQAVGAATVGSGVTVGVAFHTTIRFNSSSSADVWLNTTAGSNFDPADAYQATGTALAVGSRTGGDYANVEIAEFLVYDSALSDTDVGDVQDYLTDKWIGGAAPAVIPLVTAAATSSATLALTAPATVPLGTAAATSSATLALTAKPTVALGTAAAQSSATLALTAKPTVVLGTAAAVSSATLALTAATRIVLGTSPATSSATLALRAQTYIPLGTAAAISTATLSVTAGPGVITAQASIAVSTATLALRAQTRVVLATAGASSNATLALMTPSTPVIPLQAAAASSTATLALFAGAVFETHLPLTVEVQDASLTVIFDEGDTSIIFDSSESTVIYDETTTDVAIEGDRDADVSEHLTSVDVAEPVTTVDYDETQRTVEVA